MWTPALGRVGVKKMDMIDTAKYGTFEEFKSVYNRSHAEE